MDLKLNYKDIFDDLGLTDLSLEEKEKHFQEMQDIIQKDVFFMIYDMLDDDEKLKFESLEGDDDFDKFINERTIDIAAIAVEVAQRYRENLLADMAYFDAKLN